MKVTKAMLDKADQEHFNKEDLPSLDKLHSLSYVYHKERGHKGAKQFLTSAKVKAMVKKLEAKKKVRKKMMAKKSSAIGSADWVKRETGL